MVDVGLLLLRVVVGALLAGHGLRKLVGWFGGPGPGGEREMLRGLGYRWPRPLGWLHGGAEVAAGVLLLTGFLTPVAAGLLLAVMVNAAVAVHAPNGLWSDRGGVEYPLVLATIGAALAATGPGSIAVDTALGWQPTPGPALVAIGGGLLIGLAVLVGARQRPTGPDQRPKAAPAHEPRQAA